MNNPITRRRFFQALACAAVAIGARLPVGLPTDRISIKDYGAVGDGIVRVRWMKLPTPGLYEMFLSTDNGPLKSFIPPIISPFDGLPPPGWTELEPGKALAVYEPEPPPKWVVNKTNDILLKPGICRHDRTIQLKHRQRLIGA